MKVDFSKIGKSNSKDTIINPTELFNALSKQYQYLRDVQSQVLSEWYEKRNKCTDSVIKMNTGSGKTLVSLLILKSSLNEQKGPAIYVVPNNFLKLQVLAEAQKMGIPVTEDDEDLNFHLGKSILIINLYKLVNGKSKFLENNKNVKTMLFDDVHAILSILDNQFTLNINKNMSSHSKIINLFKDILMEQDAIKYKEFERDELHGKMIVPFWAWEKLYLNVYEILLDDKNEDEIKFKLDLIKKHLKIANCIIDRNGIEISYDNIPIDVIETFKCAERRIFTTATLANDSTLLSHFDLTLPDEAITPKSCSDIGERMILIPKLLNSQIENEKIKRELKKKSSTYNVVVLVPSEKKSKEWIEYADLIINKENIEITIDKLKKGHVGLVVLINRYEGIDLPDDACRILVIDDLPKVEKKYKKAVENILGNNLSALSDNIQKVEQGMGRGVRSREDYCVVILLGDILVDLVTRNKDKLEELFSVATLAQFNVSNSLMEQVKSKELTVENISTLMNYCLERNESWIESLKGELAEKNYNKKLRIDEETKVLRKSFNFFNRMKEKEAAENILNFINEKNIKKEMKGFLLQKAANYLHFFDEEEAQLTLKSAYEYSKLFVNPIKGVVSQRKMIKSKDQIDQIITKIKDITMNTYIIRMDSIKSKLIFKSIDFNTFEKGIEELGEILGFQSIRPDKVDGQGPDNLWALDNNIFLVIECKNEATNDFISKDNCNQLSGSINWFNSVYNKAKHLSSIPIMIHPSHYITSGTSPEENMLCIDEESLSKLKSNLSKFCNDLSKITNFDNAKIEQILKRYGLDSNSFINRYTKKYEQKRNL